MSTENIDRHQAALILGRALRGSFPFLTTEQSTTIRTDKGKAYYEVQYAARLLATAHSRPATGLEIMGMPGISFHLTYEENRKRSFQHRLRVYRARLREAVCRYHLQRRRKIIRRQHRAAQRRRKRGLA